MRRIAEFFGNTKLRTRFILGFALVIAVSGFLDGFLIRTIRQIGAIVNTVYDSSLMASTFAQSAKYDFAKYDLEVREALRANSKDDFSAHTAKAEDIIGTFQEDLRVVVERTIDERSKRTAATITGNVETIQSEFKSISSEPRSKALASWVNNKIRSSIDEALTQLTDYEAENGFNFRENAAKKNAATLEVSYILVILSIVASFVVSILLMRSVIAPLSKLTRICTEIAKGNYRLRANTQGGPEIKVLAESFNHMIGQIDQKDTNIRSLLGGMTDGLFCFGKDRAILPERSTATDSIFQDFVKHRTFEELLGAYGKHDSAGLIEAVAMLWDESCSLRFEDLAELLPKSVLVKPGTAEERHVVLSYRQQFDHEGKLDRVVVVCTDDTVELRAKRQSDYQAERVARITMIVSDMQGYDLFLSETHGTLSNIAEALGQGVKLDLPKLKRDLHSLKGGFAVYEFRTCAKMVHEIETALNQEGVAECLPKLTHQIPLIQERFRHSVEDADRVLGLKGEKGFLKVSKSKVELLKQCISEGRSERLPEIIESLETYPLPLLFDKYRKYLSVLVERSGEKFAELSFDPESSEARTDEIQPLDMVFGHLLRNSFDHAIEAPDTRSERGKPKTGVISISCRRTLRGGLAFSVGDDGAGINLAVLAEKAVRKGILSAENAKIASDDEKLELIFAPGFSTKEEATETSGRGIGLDAVRSFLLNLDGHIKVTTYPEKGTRFDFEVPSLRKTNSYKPPAAESATSARIAMDNATKRAS